MFLLQSMTPVVLIFLNSNVPFEAINMHALSFVATIASGKSLILKQEIESCIAP